MSLNKKVDNSYIFGNTISNKHVLRIPLLYLFYTNHICAVGEIIFRASVGFTALPECKNNYPDNLQIQTIY